MGSEGVAVSVKMENLLVRAIRKGHLDVSAPSVEDGNSVSRSIITAVAKPVIINVKVVDNYSTISLERAERVVQILII